MFLRIWKVYVFLSHTNKFHRELFQTDEILTGFNILYQMELEVMAENV